MYMMCLMLVWYKHGSIQAYYPWACMQESEEDTVSSSIILCLIGFETKCLTELEASYF